MAKIEIERELKKLKRKKAAGNDNLPVGMLKDASSAISSPLCFLVNMSLSQGTVPTEWKEASITPIYKSGPKNELENYRSISVLLMLSKILLGLSCTQTALNSP